MKISVVPDHRIMGRASKQQFAVYAHYPTASTEDVTRRAEYQSNDQEMASVSDAAWSVRSM